MLASFLRLANKELVLFCFFIQYFHLEKTWILLYFGDPTIPVHCLHLDKEEILQTKCVPVNESSKKWFLPHLSRVYYTNPKEGYLSGITRNFLFVCFVFISISKKELNFTIFRKYILYHTQSYKSIKYLLFKNKDVRSQRLENCTLGCIKYRELSPKIKNLCEKLYLFKILLKKNRRF